MSYIDQFQSIFGRIDAQNRALALSIGQYDIWLEQQLYPHEISNHGHFVARIQATLDLDNFQNAIWELANRHESIRTIFPILGGLPIRQVLPCTAVKLQICDCSQLSEKAIFQLIQHNFNTPFILSNAPPYKFCLYKQSDSDYYFQIVQHHIVVTVSSYASIPIELAKLYVARKDGRNLNILSESISYSAFVQQQHELYQNNRFQKDRDYWRRYLKDDLPVPILPVDVQKTNITHFTGNVVHCNVNDIIISRLKDIGCSSNASFFSVMTSAFKALLQRYVKQEEIIIGIPNDERRKTFKDLVGYTTNTLPLRSKIRGDQEFSEFLKEVNRDIRSMAKHRLYPLSMIMDDLRAEKGNAFSELFKVLVVSQETKENKEFGSFGVGQQGVTIDIDGLKYESIGMGFLPTGRFDLALAIVDTASGYVVSFHYNAALFDEAAIQGIAQNYLKILESIAQDPSKKIKELTVVCDEEQSLQLDVWNRTAEEIESGEFIAWFEKRAEESPDAIAVLFGHQEVNYGTLNRMANQLALHLQTLGAREETLIGIGLERSVELIAAILGVMKAGSAYLPLDPKLPKNRLQFMLEDSRSEILITQSSLKGIFECFEGKTVLLDKDQISTEDSAFQAHATNAHRLAYVLYTSGSTGTPKGVEITHHSLSNLLGCMQKRLHLSSSDRWLALTTISFDISQLELLLPLSQGATVVLVNQETAMDPALLTQAMEKVTFVQATPSTWQMLAEFGWNGNPALTALCGGEALPQSLADQLIGLVNTLWNMYGPTETTIWSSMKRIACKGEPITIGRPIANTAFYILDENRSIVPVGVPGELHIGGTGLARGYRHRPDLTAERFICSPFSGGKLYRTGDLVRYLPTGEIDYLGRIDHQVKIHGHRIELEEIEETLKKCPGIKQAVATVYEDKQGNKRIAAYYTGKGYEQEIKQTLSLHLPQYMLPAAYVQLSQLPLTPSGKIDRNALPIPEYVCEGLDWTAPRNEIELEIANIFEGILEVDRISIDSNFFSIGGHSLLAARAMTKINNAFGIHLPLKILLEKPSIALMAQEVQTARVHGQSAPPIPKASRTSPLHLSYSQQRFWLLDQQTQHSANYSIPFAVELEGDLNIQVFQKCLETIIQRHEILRTIVKEGLEGPEQSISPLIDLSFCLVDLSFYENPEKASAMLIAEEAKKPFNLSSGPLFRFILLRMHANRHIFFLNIHHIVFDGYSINVFLNELNILYQAYRQNLPNPLQELTIQYVDYAYWQHDLLKKHLTEERLSWWLERLNDAPSILNLPIDKPRPHRQTEHGALLEFIIDPSDAIALKKMAQKYDTTLFTVVLTLFHTLLHRYSSQRDIVIGIPISGRSHGHFDSLIGCFVNTLPLRINAKEESSFAELLKQIKQDVLNAFEYEDIPFEKIIEKLKIERSLSHTPLFQVMFNMLPKLEITKIDSLDIHLRNIDRGMAHFDLSLSIQETPEGLLGLFEFNTDLFFKETIERMCLHFQQLVKQVLLMPHQAVEKLQILLDAELKTQLIDWNVQAIDYPKNKNILTSIEEWAASTPDAIAIVCGEKSYSYRQINDRANQMAHTLLAMGIRSEDKIIVCLERSADFIAAILGILKSGGAYVPVDPVEPPERMETILRDLHPLCIVAHGAFKTHSSTCPIVNIDHLTNKPTDNPHVPLSESQLAYIIYTSGSTGKPKGVEIEHKSICDRVFWKNAAYPLNPGDAMLHTYSFIFDGAIINYLWPLCTGAALVIASKEELLDSSALVHLIHKHRITTIDLLPSLLESLLEDRDIGACQSLRDVFSGGEALPAEVVRLFYEKCSAKLHNTYGPTEATVESSVWDCEPNDKATIAPIGRPIAGAKLYILDSHQQIVPVGVPGELYIGGIGLARGYLNDPALTANKFIANPFGENAQDRLYRTGDLAKYRPDGIIDFLGRIDNQVKVRGFRIDLKEIESALLHMDPVDKAIVMVKGESLHKRLVAYVILSLSMAEKTFFELMKHYIGTRLPAHMVPAQVVILDEFPKLLNGKINYKILPEPKHQINKTILSPERECSNEMERQLLLIWKEILDCDTLRVTDNFFDAGGNSLLAMRLITRIKKHLGISVQLIRLFQYPTIEGLSKSLQNTENPWSPIVLMQPKGHKKPFFCVHPVGGGVLCYNALGKHWIDDRPFYAIQARGLEEGQIPHESLETMAREYIQAMQQIQPTGPYLIGGWSFGGLIAAEMVRQLRQLGEEISLLVLVDTTANIDHFKKINIDDESTLLSELTNRFAAAPIAEKSDLSFKERFVRFIESGGKHAHSKEQSMSDRVIALAKANYRALQRFAIPALDVNTALIRTEFNRDQSEDLGWSRYTTKLKVFHAPGDHWGIAHDDHALHYSQILQDCFVAFQKEEEFSTAGHST